MIKIKYQLIHLCFICSIFLLHSCISDEYDSCYGIRLSLNYPNAYERCEALDIHVFDSKGALFAKYRKTGRQLRPGVSYLLQIPEGDYTIAVWGDVQGRYSYTRKEVNMNEASFFNSEKPYPTSAEFWQYLVRANWDTKETKVLREDLAPLFHASMHNISLKSKEIKNINLDFIKNTNRVQVKVTGLPVGISYDKLDICIIAKNWQYYFNNTIPSETEEILYKPFSQHVKELSNSHDIASIADLSVLRIVKGRRPLLSVRDGESGNILYQRNLSELLLNLPYADLDKEDFFEVELDFRGPTISIKINGWNIIDNNQDIS